MRRAIALASAACLIASTIGASGAPRKRAKPEARPIPKDVAERYAMPPPGYTPALSSDEAGLWMQVDKMEEQVRTSPALVRDEKLNTYVKDLVCRLAGDYCPSIRVYVVETPGFNASMMPNGAMLVQTGLLLRTENEAQLAFVLGHEITHYMHRHTLQHWQDAIRTSGFLAVFSLATMGVGLGLLGLAAQAGGVSRMYANSRDQERDADAGGFVRVTDNGYDPRQAPAIWSFVAAEDKANPAKDKRAMWLSTHPAPEERLATMQKQADENAGKRNEWLVNADPFQQVTAPFLSRWAADELSLGLHDESIEMFRRLSVAMPKRGVYRYGLGEAYRKRNAGTDAAAAGEAYRGALECEDAPVEAWRGLGLIAMKAGDRETAKKAFTEYRAKAPDAEDKAMVDFYLTQL